MRTLKFIVNGLIIEKDKTCDFSGLYPGKEDLEAEFIFSQDWHNYVKVAGFWANGKEYTPQVLTDGKTCIIPKEALNNFRFEIEILGRDRNNNKRRTNKITIRQFGGTK